MLTDHTDNTMPLQPLADQPKIRRKNSLSLTLFTQALKISLPDESSAFTEVKTPTIPDSLSSLSVLDILSHELRTPLHTLQQSARALEKMFTELQTPREPHEKIEKQTEFHAKLKHLPTYLCYIDASLKRLSTFLNTGRPADGGREVQEDKLFSDIARQASAPVNVMQKSYTDLQHIANTLMKRDLDEKISVHFTMANQKDQLKGNLNKIKSALDTLISLIPAQDSSPIETIEKSDPISFSPPPDTAIKVLVVEDNVINQKLLEKILKRRQYTVDVAPNGAQGVKLFQPGKYDLVLMDIHMPIMDGYEATQHMRRLEAESLSPATPIITLTANAPTLENKEKAREAGMDDFLSKPYRPADIYRLIKKYSYKEVPSPTQEELNSPPRSPIQTQRSDPTMALTASLSSLMSLSVMTTQSRFPSRSQSLDGTIQPMTLTATLTTTL